MDIFAHFLWTFAIYWQHPKRWIAGLIGMTPDLLSFGIFTVQRVISTGFHLGPPFGTIPTYVYTMYDITHSLVIFALGATLLWFFARDWFWLSGGWLLHIMIDLPTHTGAFFPTPFLWPLSDFRLSGVSWGASWFMAANYGSLLILYTWLLTKNFKIPASGETS
jgi:hypothetical protein